MKKYINFRQKISFFSFLNTSSAWGKEVPIFEFLKTLLPKLKLNQVGLNDTSFDLGMVRIGLLLSDIYFFGYRIRNLHMRYTFKLLSM